MTGSSLGRSQELLADRVLWGLSAPEERELHDILDLTGARAEVLRWEHAASAAAVAILAEVVEPPPEHLLRRLQGDALAYFARQRGMQMSRKWSSPWISRTLAAAAILVAFGLWWTRPVQSSPSSIRERMASLMDLPEVFRSDWNPGPSSLRGDVRGELVWSDTAQEGYMRFVGLPANDSRQSQYQLWIFDSTRSDAHPVDGGVFDIGSASDELVIPIRTKLRVGAAKMFAITVERPGGVVVSDREHVVALAGP